MNSIKIFVIAFVAFLFGGVFSAVALNVAAPQMMIQEMASPYDYEKSVRLVKERVTANEGWNIVAVTEQEGIKSGRVTTIRLSDDAIAAKVLENDALKKFASALPKSIGVYEMSNGKVYISVCNGKVKATLFGGEAGSAIGKMSKEIGSALSFVHTK